MRLPSLVPRPLPERVRARYTLFVHASNFLCDFPYIFQDTLLSTLVMYGIQKTFLRVTTANHYAIRRSKVSSFVTYNTDRLQKRNAETYTKISKFPMFTEKIEHIRKQCVPGLLSFREGPGYEASGYWVYIYVPGWQLLSRFRSGISSG